MQIDLENLLVFEEASKDTDPSALLEGGAGTYRDEEGIDSVASNEKEDA